MSEDKPEPRGDLRWGIGASVLLHGAIAVAVLVHFTPDMLKPNEQKAVQVQLVEPPKSEQAAKKKEEAAKKPPEPEKKEAKQPPPPEKKAETQPAPAEKKEKPPPPPPEKNEQTAPKQPPPKAQAKQPEEANKEDRRAGTPLEVLKPVFKYGDKDSGPKKSADGNSSSGAADKATSSALDAADRAAAGEAKPSPKAPGTPAPTDIELPKANLADGIAKPGLPGVEQEANPPYEIKRSANEKAPAADASKADNAKTTADMKPVRTLYSQDAAGGAEAAAAMAGTPRDIRISQLCTTELREQLRHASPPYQPALLPAYRLREGNLLTVKSAAFRTRTEWYDLSFQCEVDDGATRVVSFAFDVGAPVPKDQWKARGFPE